MCSSDLGATLFPTFAGVLLVEAIKQIYGAAPTAATARRQRRFVVPPGGETLALRVFNLLHYGHHAQVNALCLILLLLAVLPLAAWAVFGLFKKKPAHD